MKQLMRIEQFSSRARVFRHRFSNTLQVFSNDTQQPNIDKRKSCSPNCHEYFSQKFSKKYCSLADIRSKNCQPRDLRNRRLPSLRLFRPSWGFLTSWAILIIIFELFRLFYARISHFRNIFSWELFCYGQFHVP